jgi:hypothetical protein
MTLRPLAQALADLTRCRKSKGKRTNLTGRNRITCIQSHYESIRAAPRQIPAQLAGPCHRATVSGGTDPLEWECQADASTRGNSIIAVCDARSIPTAADRGGVSLTGRTELSFTCCDVVSVVGGPGLAFAITIAAGDGSDTSSARDHIPTYSASHQRHLGLPPGLWLKASGRRRGSSGHHH